MSLKTVGASLSLGRLISGGAGCDRQSYVGSNMQVSSTCRLVEAMIDYKII